MLTYYSRNLKYVDNNKGHFDFVHSIVLELEVFIDKFNVFFCDGQPKPPNSITCSWSALPYEKV